MCAPCAWLCAEFEDKILTLSLLFPKVKVENQYHLSDPGSPHSQPQCRRQELGGL